jgi:murein DD-endopeptidase MepM/ murein hydrolase activator NlpD
VKFLHLLPASLTLFAGACATTGPLHPPPRTIDTGFRQVASVGSLGELTNLTTGTIRQMTPVTSHIAPDGVSFSPVPISLAEINVPDIPPAPRRTEAAATPSHDDGPLALHSLDWPVTRFHYVRGFFPARGHRRAHHGVDLAAPRGTPIHAVLAGRVVEARSSGNGYGRWVVIDHGHGLRTIYAHCSHIDVHAGDRVDAGDVIAEVGTTGNATGSHVHFEVRIDGEPVDPEPYLPPRGVATSD